MRQKGEGRWEEEEGRIRKVRIIGLGERENRDVCMGRKGGRGEVKGKGQARSITVCCWI